MKRLRNGIFWLDAIERAIRAAAASALGMLGGEQLGVLDADWGKTGSIAGMAAVVSLLFSIVAGTTGDARTAGFTTDSR